MFKTDQQPPLPQILGFKIEQIKQIVVLASIKTYHNQKSSTAYMLN